MEETKTFKRSKDFIINTIYDIIELQKGRLILSDAVRGIVCYKISMYGYEWELMYTIAPDAPEGQSSATLRIFGERRETEKEMRRAFKLLESMLDI